MDGYIHSIESFGTVDGPGVRMVVFLQGCPMRCRYCHNPDTWEVGIGTRMSPLALIDQFQKNRPFYRNGGITVTGGEPLLQIDFLLELFRLAKAQDIHTCLDTSGATYRPGDTLYNQKLTELLSLTNLVMLDLKLMDPEGHRELTGMTNSGILAFAALLRDHKVPTWIRHVVVPGITDSEEHLRALGQFMGTLTNLQALDVLPYHTMGTTKYEELGIPYPLAGLEAATKEQALAAKKIILESYRESRRKLDQEK